MGWAIPASGSRSDPVDYCARAVYAALAFAAASGAALAASVLLGIGWLVPLAAALVPQGATVLALALALPHLRAKLRGYAMDAHALDALTLLYCLTSSGYDLDRASAELAAELPRPAAAPFKSYLYARSVLGLGRGEALRWSAGRCPSERVRRILLAVAEAEESLGDPSRALEHLRARELAEERAAVRRRARAMALAAEAYIVLVVLLPALAATAAVVFSVAGGSIFGLPGPQVTALSVLAAIVVCAVFTAIVGG